MLRTASILALALAAPAFAGGPVDDFEGGVNQGGWAFIAGADILETTGGNPGGWLHNPLYDTFAPSCTTNDGIASGFVGDYRALGVTNLTFDARTLDTDFGVAGFEMSILLRDTKGTATINDDDYTYFVGPEIPLPGGGWKSFDFVIPSQSMVAVPPGWKGGWVGDGENFRPGIDWNDVITSVDRVEIWWFDPSLFAIFQQWNVGIDNIALVQGDPVWVDLGQGLAGVAGVPLLEGLGTLVAGQQMGLRLTGAAPSAATTLVIGLSQLGAPFKGGTLVPSPDVVLPGLLTNGAGALLLPSIWPAGIPAGTVLYFQEWITDAAGPKGLSASNGLSGTAQ